MERPPPTTSTPSVPTHAPLPIPADVTHVGGLPVEERLAEVERGAWVAYRCVWRVAAILVAVQLIGLSVATWLVVAKLEDVRRLIAAGTAAEGK